MRHEKIESIAGACLIRLGIELFVVSDFQRAKYGRTLRGTLHFGLISTQINIYKLCINIMSLG